MSSILNMDLKSELSKRYTDLRKEAGFSQESLAEAIDVSRSTYNKYENGESEPVASTLVKMAVEFNVSPGNLLLDDEEGLTPCGREIGLVWSKLAHKPQQLALEISLAIKSVFERDETLRRAPNSKLRKL